MAPILGHLGTYTDTNAMAADTRSWVTRIASVNGRKGVVTGVHFIYALATPCKGAERCLEYLDG